MGMVMEKMKGTLLAKRIRIVTGLNALDHHQIRQPPALWSQQIKSEHQVEIKIRGR
jgi:hypothetical protein